MFCSKCGGANNEGVSFCAKCGAAIGTAGAAGPGSETTTMRGHGSAATRTVVGKNPTVALVLSIFLGALGGGQFYNGDWKKGLAMAVATLVLSVPTGGVVAFAIWVWSMVDAYQVASGKWSIW